MDRHTLMVRRRVAAGVAVVLLILIVLLINGCLKSQQQQSLKDYNHSVGQLAAESDTQVAKPFFTTLSGASGKPALDVEVQVGQQRIAAQNIANRAQALSVPGAMKEAQRYLLLVLGLRVEGITKIAALLPAALGGQNKQSTTLIAGDMETFLASDVVYSQRVAPLIQEALTSNGIRGLSTASSRFLPNLGWLEPTTVQSRLTGQGSSGESQSSAAPGTHGSALTGTSVGATALEAEPALNHVSGGANPTFTATVENTGSNPEKSVKVDVTVTAAGRQYKASRAIPETTPGNKSTVEVPVTGVPLGAAAKVEVSIEPVPGETNPENNKATYLAIFGP